MAARACISQSGCVVGASLDSVCGHWAVLGERHHPDSQVLQLELVCSSALLSSAGLVLPPG